MREARPLKLLVVDDEKGIVDFTQKIYSRRGFITFGATDGVSAIEIFRKERPDISLIDIHMPYSPIDGVETLRKIKEMNNDALCIMVTRITENKSVEESRKLGASAYVSKPLRVEELDKAISEVAKIDL
ncbi:MAG: response regulator [Candidatus Omnitrophica bacterium]|nr:response regulator [Candidatus Omnitrophota bacterium]